KNKKLRDLNIFVDIYPVRDCKNEMQYIYLFEKSMITDNIVEDIIEHIDEVVVIFNKDGVIEKMNSICDEILPFKRKDVLGRSIDKLVYMGLVEEPIILNMLEVKKKTYKNIVYPGGKSNSIYGSSYI
ncbi:AAA family ATPase, partial [Paeniclostridium sordellii]|nr:AAA family ATPase [Paeniclostridium sordellii]